ncbi:helix-turn-helix domain-containing protein [Magnetospirillum fulvum]|uniref:helix-turn-helix domain-containing protein n=1 Tax=Magnetospirillum fulvum TaxID=1082 RepID=UPI0012DECEBA|nr:helix-turn-helix domain-containing protein [Magnetospirillum fulvum]
MTTANLRRQPHPDLGFLSRQQLAELTGISVSFFDHLPAGELPYFKRGGRAFYERAAVVAWIKGHAPQQTEPLPVARKKGRPSKPVIQGGIAAASVR